MLGTKQNLFEEPSLRREPSGDEIEVSLFGKGSGECLVLHLGSGRYVTIDSFINPETKRPVAFDYLEAIGVSIENIECVVVTHWHKDHVLGVAQLARDVSTNVRFVMPAVIRDDLFLEFLKVNKRQLNQQSPTAEFDLALKKLLERGMKIVLATNDKFIFTNEVELLGLSKQNVNLYTLSPNDNQLFNYLLYLKNQVAKQSVNPGVTSANENSISTVLWLDFLGDKVLVGGDLLIDGWREIVKERIVKGKASLFKVPHHGSITGHLGSVWEDMLAPKPISLLSVYNPSGLPRDADRERIKALSKHMFVAGSKADVVKNPNFFRKLEKYSSVKLRPLDASIGIIRARKRIGTSSDWTIECFGNVEDPR